MKKNNTGKTLRYFWQALKEHRLITFVIWGAILGASIVEIIIPLYFKDFFNKLASNVNKDIVFPSIISLLIIIALYKLLRWFLWRIAGFSMSHQQSKIVAELSDKCFKNLHKHSFSFFNNNFVGSLVKRVKWFTGAFETVNDELVYHIIPMFVNIIAIVIVLSFINIYLALGILTWVVVFLTINWFFTNYKLKYDIKRNEIESKATGFLADTITNNSNVKLFNGYKREVDGFFNINDDLRRVRRFAWFLGDTFESIQGFLMIVLEIGMFVAAAWFWQKGQLTVGDFVLLQAYLINIFMVVWNFGRVIRRIYEALSNADEMTQILETTHEIVDIPRAKELVVVKGKIELKKALFNYNETRSVIKKVDLEIPPRQRIAIIGPSGAGKTTIVKLLFRMHELTSGKILIDGQDISKVTQESLWKNVSLVPQDPILFHRTLMENIKYGNPNASEEEVLEASKAAHCHEFIINCPDGYETYVGERGIKLSGGERQRVAIARAILKNAPILILDEATSSLDSESEQLIQNALNKLMENKTVIVIAHRLSTISKMDRIIVIENGSIIEDGSHAKLAKVKDGLYSKLWDLQAGGFFKATE